MALPTERLVVFVCPFSCGLPFATGDAVVVCDNGEAAAAADVDDGDEDVAAAVAAASAAAFMYC